ncbi:glycosyltransferase family 4 protein [Paenibacillus sp. TRM 82003]|nr:glycosyltransferase family 4 protein [Paenibacillus sp. TRM 82003]
MKNRRDVLFLCQFFYPEYVSSATLPFDTASALSEAGFSVGALVGYPKEYNNAQEAPLKEIHNNIEIKRVKYVQLKRTNILGRLINYFSFACFIALHFFEFRKYKSVIVYSNPPILPLIASFANTCFGTKVIFVSYDVYPEMAYATKSFSERSLLGKVMRFVNTRVFHKVNKVVALSNEMKSFLLKNRPNLSEERVEVIPNWYEDKNELNNITEEPNGVLFRSIKERAKLTVSYFGNMGICQDLGTIVNAIRELKGNQEVQFVFAGHGNKLEQLKNIVTDENLRNVTVFDFLHGKDFQEALRISDCFIVSLADGLTGLAVPSKTYSYMMAGKPILAIIGDDSDIAKDLHTNNAGFALKVGEHWKLVSAINGLLNDEHKRLEMGKNCRNIFLRKYTKQHCTDQYVKLIERVLMEEKQYV